MDELLEALNQATNVSSIYYSKESMMWEVGYRPELGYEVDHVPANEIVEFLYNG